MADGVTETASVAALLCTALPPFVFAGAELKVLLRDVDASAWLWAVTWTGGKDDKVCAGSCAASVRELEEGPEAAIALAISFWVLDCELPNFVAVGASELVGEVETCNVLEVSCTLPND